MLKPIGREPRTKRQGKPRHPKLPIASLSLNVLNREQGQGKARQGKASQSHDMPKQGKAKHVKATTRQGKACPGKARQGMPRQVKVVRREGKYVKIQSVGSVASPSFGGKLNGKRGGRDESKRRRAKSQWIVIARPLYYLQYPVTYLSRLQRILPAAQ
ncbi:unnamed protein product [Prunus armeniaca]|uniref:Uncharacterized protein n=1 Tax=Prunus armeniaca TaxID=36596 RepID=A0A6J5UR60_PRUAR|nr:unnamed protein product [Prunus armeniaca]